LSTELGVTFERGMSKYDIFMLIYRHSAFSLSHFNKKIELERVYRLFTGDYPQKSKTKYQIANSLNFLVTQRVTTNARNGILLTDPLIAEWYKV
jgi:hypothetical protein